MFGLDSLATYVYLLKTSHIYISQFFRFGLPTNPVGIFCRKFNPSSKACQDKCLRMYVYNIFSADFKPIPVKVETTVSFRFFSFKYFFSPAIVAEEVGSIK